METDNFISCDWGTSNFRLKLVETENLKVVVEHHTTCGIKVINQLFLKQQAQDRLAFFSDYLKQEIQQFPKPYRDLPVVVSGMASSSIGLKELEYAEMPFNLDGRGLLCEHLSTATGLNLLLISGVKSQDHMMRGEETQAIGLSSELIKYKRGILILPGTHSKHLTFDQRKFISLKNFMTGELFEVLATTSILSSSIEKTTWSGMVESAFLDGVVLGAAGKLSSSLLMIRANQVVKGGGKEDNYYLLSGLLIGDELSYLKKGSKKVLLVAPQNLIPLYAKALENIVDPSRLVIFDRGTLDYALLTGQRKMLAQYDQ